MRLARGLTNTSLRSFIPKKGIRTAASSASVMPSVLEAAAPALRVVEPLQPQPLWNFFAQLSAIPRPSKAEEKVVAWLRDFATDRGLDFKQDATGNVLISRPGSAGGEHAPSVMLQGHIDMVCEANSDKKHDFYADPLTLKFTADGHWLKADGTTLGSDNGIGVCAALALLDAPKTQKLPPLEALFTIDEETGLTGAFGLDGSMIKSKILLNLDTENIDEIIIGCAGGGDTHYTMPASLVPAPSSGYTAFHVAVKGFKGGHSGVNIHECRGNATVALARVLANAGKALGALPLIAQIKAGDKRNAISREGEALVLVPSGKAADLEASVKASAADFAAEYGLYEPDMCVECAAAPLPSEGKVVKAEEAQRLVDLLRALPHGVHKLSHAIPGLVETSNNVASVRLDTAAGTALVVTSTRSSIMSALEAHRDQLEIIARGLGALKIDREEAYPGWAPRTDTRVLEVTKASYRRVMGKDAHVTAIHAGLECGILTDKVPGMQAVSFGPTITGAHSPDEMVHVASVEKFWAILLDLVTTLADDKA